MVTIDTTRLVLRPFEASDAGPLLGIHRDPEIIKYSLMGTPINNITGSWRFIALKIGHWHLRGYGEWAVVEKATLQTIGRAGLYHPEGWPGPELGWMIGRAWWGHGFATEAAGRALQWVWDETGIDHVISLIEPDNRRSIRVAEKIGERFERAEVVGKVDFHTYGIYRC